MDKKVFDQVIDRRGTNSLKHDFAVERNHPADALPLWVADMDFQAPSCVLEALQKTVAHGIFGYSEVKHAYYQAIADWFESQHGWKPEEEWLVKTPGIVYAIAMAVRAATKPQDAVLIQPPVYYPFHEVIRDNDRKIIENTLDFKDGVYRIDFKDFEEKIAKNEVKLFLLCSPHNPVGRVWTEEELRRMGEICRKYGVTVVSDEIHCDFAFPEHPHTPFIKACPELAERTILCTSPSKSFNLAGLQISNIFIPGKELRAAFKKEIDKSGYSQLNVMGLTACQAAYEGGKEWQDTVKEYMRDNLAKLRSYLEEKLPQIRLIEPEGMYFAWMDFSALGLSNEELEGLVSRKAKLWLDSGAVFGGGAEQFQRMVLACPWSVVEEALKRLEGALNQ